MTMVEFRRQIQMIDWPVVMRVDGQEIAINSREELMIPNAGNLICIYHGGAFQVIDCKHISIIRREKADGRRSA